MKRLFLLACLVAACGASSKNEASDNSASRPEPSTKPVADEPVAKAEPTAPTHGVPCTQEVARVCPSGMVDSCGLQLTANHECVKADAKAGPVCEAEIALICPDDQVDICERKESAPTHHLCVLK